VLVLVEVLGDGLARARERLGGVVLEVLVGSSEMPRLRGSVDELADQGDDVVVRETRVLEVDVEPRRELSL
jgi:hypothetical protein